VSEPEHADEAGHGGGDADGGIRERRLGDELTWFSHCHGDERPGRHLHLSQYLVGTPDGNVLVDAGAGHDTDLVDTLGERVDSLDAVLLTHAIMPHTGGIAALREAFPETTVVSTSSIPAAVGVENAAPAVINDTEEIAGDTFTFIDPLLTDVVVSTWVYHHDSGTMFTAEGVGHYHAPGECERLSTEYPDGVPREYVREFAADKLRFLEYVDPEKLRIAFDTLREEYEVERFAPIHGTPVEAADVEGYVETLVDVAGEF
jgi:glyoxylase-like metal-dependent hydrolase (beta-lactamase superfamily II)